jgi:geranylgeranyl pyrophosphate synthase
MERVNARILSRTGSEVAMIPEVANHLISSGGKRLRPMLTLATAGLAGYEGEGHVKLAASVEFMHTPTLLHDDVVDESDMRRGRWRRGALGQRGERSRGRLPARARPSDDGDEGRHSRPGDPVRRRP